MIKMHLYWCNPKEEVVMVMSNMKKRFPHIQCVVALAYMPSANNPKFPMGIETVARKKQKYVINLAADTPFSAEP